MAASALGAFCRSGGQKQALSAACLPPDAAFDERGKNRGGSMAIQKGSRTTAGGGEAVLLKEAFTFSSGV